jgi:predicted dehydrogenase
MRTMFGVIGTLVIATAVHGASPNPQSAPKNDQTSMVIVFKDGHQETFSMAEIARVEYRDSSEATVGPEQFLGKWEAGAGDGAGSTFFITFEVDGEASKSIGASHGTWSIVGDEARLSWDDGWHDILRKVGDKGRYEKFAFAPDTSIDDKPANVTDARKIDSKP